MRDLAAILLMGAIALPAAAAVADEQILQSPSGDITVALVQDVDGVWIERPGRSSQRVHLDRRVTVSSFRTLGDGWIAAGIRQRGEETDLELLHAGPGGTVTRLPVPTGRRGALRTGPRTLVEDGELAGLAWLEGDDPRSFAVRFADWSGVGFGPPGTVSPAGAGSQLALESAVLDDGAWLVAWSAFDGQDDEIYWSLRDGSGWTPPRPAAAGNAFPDITPSLVPVPGGALLAWSRYDGSDYRLVVSRFLGNGWSEPRTLGDPGSVFPTLLADDSGAYLLARTVRPGGWSLAELTSDGEPRRWARELTDTRDRPLVLPGTGSVTWRWPRAREERTATWSSLP